jgi:hypothetical protein
MEVLEKRLNRGLINKSRKNPKGWSTYLKKLKKIEFTENGGHINIEQLFFVSVIYFLYCKEEVVYVGQTTSLMTRISQHVQENTKIFTSFKFIIFNGSEKERLQKEMEFIKQIKPVYNIAHN